MEREGEGEREGRKKGWRETDRKTKMGRQRQMGGEREVAYLLSHNVCGIALCFEKLREDGVVAAEIRLLSSIDYAVLQSNRTVLTIVLSY